MKKFIRFTNPNLVSIFGWNLFRDVTVVCLPLITLFTARRSFNLRSESGTGFTVNMDPDSIIGCVWVVYHEDGVREIVEDDVSGGRLYGLVDVQSQCLTEPLDGVVEVLIVVRHLAQLETVVSCPTTIRSLKHSNSNLNATWPAVA